MSEYLGQHWIVTIFITILLGAIGSGVWEAAIKPYGARLGNAVYSLITFGAKRAKDRIYKNAAMGHHELPSLHILLMIFCLIFGSVIFTQIIFWVPNTQVVEFRSAIDACRALPQDAARDCIRHEIRSSLSTYINVLTVLSILVAIFLFRTFHSINKTNLVVTYFEQSISALGPCLDRQLECELRQAFALMESESDYLSIVAKMVDLASAHNVRLPKSYV